MIHDVLSLNTHPILFTRGKNSMSSLHFKQLWRLPKLKLIKCWACNNDRTLSIQTKSADYFGLFFDVVHNWNWQITKSSLTKSLISSRSRANYLVTNTQRRFVQSVAPFFPRNKSFLEITLYGRQLQVF